MSIATDLQQAWALLQQDRARDALHVAQRVLEAEPGNISAVACRAMALEGLGGSREQPLSEMARAVALAPETSALRFNYGLMLGRAGRFGLAAEQHRRAFELDPANVQAFWSLTYSEKVTNYDGIIRGAEELFARRSLPASQQELLGFGLAKAFDDLDLRDRAMRFAIEANRLAERPWDRAGAEAMLADLRRAADDGRFSRMRTSGHPTRAPLFIVGMPRSGTTLVETILSRHPDILALGESSQIPDAAGTIGRIAGPSGLIERAVEFKRDWLKVRAEGLIRAWGAKAGVVPAIVTDKMPDNLYALGFIQQLFPAARVIYMRRHPLDNGVSNFFTRFNDGNSFSTRLDWVGARARQAAETMDIWKRTLSLPILDVRYERLVAQPEAEIRRIANFAGLGWTDDLLTPERAAGTAKTASSWQVKQPIHSKSVARWRRYESWLGPMIEAMGGFDWIDAQLEDGMLPGDSAAEAVR